MNFANHYHPSINIDCKFSYGKHGETELKRLFSRIGIGNIFEDVTIIEELETVSGFVEIEINFNETFNSITDIRNNILHQDATPSLTLSTVKKYREQFEHFSVELAKFIAFQVDSIDALCKQPETA